MLVLTRKVGEKVIIDGGIELVVVKIDRKQVRLALRAPDHVKIMRAELCSAEGMEVVVDAEGAVGRWS